MRKVILTKKNNRYSNRKFSKKNNNKHKQGKYKMFGGSSQVNIKEFPSHEEAENFMHDLFSNRKLIKTYNIILAKEPGESRLTIIIYYIKIINSIPNRKTFAFQIGDYKFNIYEEVNKHLTKIGHLNGIRPASAPENTIIFNHTNSGLAQKHNEPTRLLIKKPNQVQKRDFILKNRQERQEQRQGQIKQLEDPLIPPPFMFSAKGIEQEKADIAAAIAAVENFEKEQAAKSAAAQPAAAQPATVNAKEQIPLIIYRSHSCSFDTLLSMFHTIDRYSSDTPIKSLLNGAIRIISTSNIRKFRPNSENQPKGIPYWKVPIAQAEEEFVEKTLQFIYMLNHILDTVSSGKGINCEGNLRPVVNNILKLINFKDPRDKNGVVRDKNFGIYYKSQINMDTEDGPFNFDLFNNFVNSSFIDIVLLISCFLKIFPNVFSINKKIGFELYYNFNGDSNYDPVNDFKASDYTGDEEVIFIPYVANAEVHPPYLPPHMITKNSNHILIGIILRTPGHYESVNYMDNSWYYYDGRRYNGRAYPLISYETQDSMKNHKLATLALFSDKGNIGMTVRTLSSVFVYVKTNTTNSN